MLPQILVQFLSIFLPHTGVYHSTTKEGAYGHAVKIIGWGVEKDTPYWLCANSWGTEWGDNGFFKIIRGNNECEIENNVVAGLMKIE